MSAPVTARELEAARKACPCWGDGETGPRECGDGRVCELHYHVAQALADADAAGYERGRREQRWPEATGRDKEGGWTIDPAFLGRIQDRMGDDEFAPPWEGIEAVLLAVTAIRASAGPDGRET